MGRTLALFAIGLVFGCGIGFVVAAGSGITFGDHDHGNVGQHKGTDHDAMHASQVEMSEANGPSVKIMLMPDPMTGFNLHMMTRNFNFAPQAASTAHVPGKGHAHVYINGVKLGRYYSPWVHLDALPQGDVKVRVTLNANDHRVYAVSGTPVDAAARLTNP